MKLTVELLNRICNEDNIGLKQCLSKTGENRLTLSFL